MLIFNDYLVVIQRRQAKVVLSLDLVEVVKFRWSYRNPPPFGMCFVLNRDAPITVHRGVPCLDPFFGFLVGERSIAFSSASTNGNVHRACVGYIAKSNVVGSLVGVDVSRQDEVDVVFHEERFQVFFGSKYLGIMVVKGKGIINRGMHR